jgi:predicted aspartyl protease
MAAVSTSRRSAAGIALVVAGALLLLHVVLGLAGVTATGSWLLVLGYLAIAVAFLVLAIASFRSTVARIALIVGAVGWLLLALQSVVALPAVLLTIAAIAAALGGVVASIVLYVGKEITNNSAIAFIVTTIVAAIILLAGVAGAALGTIGSVLWIVFGIGLVITGVLFARTQGSRGR